MESGKKCVAIVVKPVLTSLTLQSFFDVRPIGGSGVLCLAEYSSWTEGKD